MCIYHLLVEGYLGCFQFLDIVNRAIMNMVYQIFVEFHIKNFGFILRSGIDGYMVDLILSFTEMSTLIASV